MLTSLHGLDPICMTEQHCLDSTGQAALERQDLSCTYLAHHELESVLIIIIIIIYDRTALPES